MSALAAEGAVVRSVAAAPVNAAAYAQLVGRLERLPVTPRLMLLRVIVGIATFFDAYTVLAIAFAMPQLVAEWKLTPAEVGLIISAGYVGQLFGAVIFGALAERFGRLKILFITIILFVSMDVACLFAWSSASMMLFRFLQGVGTGGEVPVASAYINEFIGAEKRGRFFLLYEVIFPIGLMFAGMVGFFLVPVYGWKAMFIVGLVPSVLTIPLRWLMPESPRWLASRGRTAEADAVVTLLEDSATRRGLVLREPAVRPLDAAAVARSDWRELFRGIYLKRTLMIWGLWVCAYMINNGLVTWLPTLYKQVFQLPLQTALAYGWITSSVGVVASIICALAIDRVGRKPWYATAFLLATVPLLALAWLGATSAIEVLILATATYAVLQTIAFSLYLYSAELYPTRLRAVGTGFGSAWLRAGSSVGPILVGWIVADLGIRYVFAAFAAVALVGGLVTLMFAIETRGRVLEELSP
ncbi:MFS transporter [Bradyrhizobium prioriisuperbiae]|uniref:MFS transporter n=1 Tax=Bradyrhizobium prioriisuperbiae TaxID=2854389 RepID=UPI0028E584A7|nr:MFS transporter [Bradyrhizobium prioritasuperba]